VIYFFFQESLEKRFTLLDDDLFFFFVTLFLYIFLGMHRLLHTCVDSSSTIQLKDTNRERERERKYERLISS
jgi:hypothetical protein